MRLRVVPLIAGLFMIALGVGVIGTADRMGDKIIYALMLLGCLGMLVQQPGARPGLSVPCSSQWRCS